MHPKTRLIAFCGGEADTSGAICQEALVIVQAPTLEHSLDRNGRNGVYHHIDHTVDHIFGNAYIGIDIEGRSKWVARLHAHGRLFFRKYM